jgi:hypothetical protein
VNLGAAPSIHPTLWASIATIRTRRRASAALGRIPMPAVTAVSVRCAVSATATPAGCSWARGRGARLLGRPGAARARECVAGAATRRCGSSCMRGGAELGTAARTLHSNTGLAVDASSLVSLSGLKCLHRGRSSEQDGYFVPIMCFCGRDSPPDFEILESYVHIRAITLQDLRNPPRIPERGIESSRRGIKGLILQTATAGHSGTRTHRGTRHAVAEAHGHRHTRSQRRTVTDTHGRTTPWQRHTVAEDTVAEAHESQQGRRV